MLSPVKKRMTCCHVQTAGHSEKTNKFAQTLATPYLHRNQPTSKTQPFLASSRLSRSAVRKIYQGSAWALLHEAPATAGAVVDPPPSILQAFHIEAWLRLQCYSTVLLPLHQLQFGVLGSFPISASLIPQSDTARRSSLNGSVEIADRKPLLFWA